MKHRPMIHRSSRRRFVWIVPIALILVALAALAANGQTWNKIRTLASLQRVDNYPLYVMRYYGDYGFAERLQRGIHPQQSQGDELGLVGEACSTFAALNDNGELCLGRNFDWNRRASLLLFTDPPDGYASVALVDLQYFGSFDHDPDLTERQALLSAPYFSFDGMNECGVAIGTMLVPCGDLQASDKTTISDLEVIRLVLDYASSVEKAIALLEEHKIRFSPNGCLHYLVADATGHSAVIEFWDGEMIVLRNQEDWQVATNFLLSQCPVDLTEQPYYSCARYGKAWETLQRANGRLTMQEAMHLLQDVSQSNTKWSVVYGLTTGDVRVAMGRNYDRVHEFRLKLRPN